MDAAKELEQERRASPLQAAYAYAALGLPVLPLCGPTHKGCADRGKVPFDPHTEKHMTSWQARGVPTREEIDAWLATRTGPRCNIGLVLGSHSGLVALDVDGPGGERLLAEKLGEDLPPTWEYRTGGGGRRLIYRIPAGVKLRSVTLRADGDHQGLEVLSDGRQAVLPPSVHPNGRGYEWVPGCSPWDMPPALAPQRLIDLAGPPKGSKAPQVVDVGPDADEALRILAEQCPRFAEALATQEADGCDEETWFRWVALLTAAAGPQAAEAFSRRSVKHAPRSDRRIELLQQNPPPGMVRCVQFGCGVEQIQQCFGVVRYNEAGEPSNSPGAFLVRAQRHSRQVEIAPDEIPTPRLPEEWAEPLPLEALPGPIRRYVEEAAESLACPPDFVAAGTLAGLSVAVGLSRELVIKPDWRETGALWIALVNPPGTKKSPAAGKALVPVFRRQEALARQHAQALEAWEQAHARWEAEIAAWNKAARKGEDPGERPPEPERPTMGQVVVSDTTIEALADVLARNPRGVLLYRDELSGWVRDMARYAERGGDRQHYLSAWAGQPMVINRRNRPDPLIIARPYLAVFGGLPPDLLPELQGEEGRHDGFLDRFVFVAPPTGEDRFSETIVSQEARDALLALFDRLWELQPEMRPGEPPRPVPVQISPRAAGLWKEWYEEHARRLNDPDLPPVLRGPEAKMPAQVARLALLIYLARWAAGEGEGDALDAESLVMALELGDYFRSHARRVYGELVAAEDKDVRKLVVAAAWIRRKDPAGQGVTIRDLLRSNVAGCQTAEDVERLFRALAQRGFGEVREEVAGGYRRLRFVSRRREHGGEEERQAA